MCVSDDNYTVLKSGNITYKPYAVYSAKPLRETSFFEVQISLMLTYCTGKIMMGLCRVPKNSSITYFNHQTPLYEASNFCMWHNGAVWNSFSSIHTKISYGSIHLTDLKSLDRVGLNISLAGDLAFYVNGQYQGLAARNVYLESCDVYAVVVMLESCDSITVTKSGMKFYLTVPFITFLFIFYRYSMRYQTC